MVTARLRQARASLMVSYLLQGTVFALLVTRIPGVQKHYGITDGQLPIFLAAVPILAGVGSLSMEWVVKRTSPRAVLRVVQPVVCLVLVGVGLGHAVWQGALVLAAFGLAVGGLDSSQAMSAVSLQRRYGRSVMQGFYAVYSLGGIIGASLAWAQVHFHTSLLAMFGTTGGVTAVLALAICHWYAGPEELGDAVAQAEQAAAARIPWRPLLPLCVAMTVAYIGDSTVSNWSAKYLQDGLHSSDQLSTVPYNVYMAVTLVARLAGDRLVQRWQSVRTVRVGAVVCAVGFGLTAVAPSPWVAIAAFAVIGLGISVIVPQVFAAGGRLFPGDSDAAVARINIFNYVGFLVGSPLVGGLAAGTGYRVAMAVPLLLVLCVLPVSPHFGAARPAPEAVTV